MEAPEWEDPSEERGWRSPTEDVVGWRKTQLERAGWDPVNAEMLAERIDIDLHLAEDFAAKPCPHELALAILL